MRPSAATLPGPAAAESDGPLATFFRRLRHLEPATLLWVILVAVLLFLVVSPMAKLFLISFETRGTGAITLSNYFEAYGKARYIEALGNSLLLGTLSALLSLIFALPMAWAVSRTDMPLRGLTWGVVLGAFIMPPYLAAIGWILLAGPNAGWINQAWTAVTGDPDSLVNVYTFTGLAVVIALHSFPFIFIFVKAALDMVSSELEDAANILGPGPWRTLVTVPLPPAWPATPAGLLLVFLETMAPGSAEPR